MILQVYPFHIRERERELFGPKKRGPKPETFLLKVRGSSDGFHFFSSLTHDTDGYRRCVISNDGLNSPPKNLQWNDPKGNA